MTTRETLRPSWRDSENLPFEFVAGAAGGIDLGPAGSEGSSAGSGAADLASAAFTGGGATVVVVVMGSGAGGAGAGAVARAGDRTGGGGGATMGATGVLATIGVVATARRKSM